MKTVIEMAREAGWKDLRDYDSEMRHDFFMGNTDSLARFAELVRADERNRVWTQSDWTEYEHAIAAAEREAVLDLVDDYAKGNTDLRDAIRARGNGT